MSKKEMTTEKRLKVRLYLSLLVYTVVGYGLTPVSYTHLTRTVEVTIRVGFVTSFRA